MKDKKQKKERRAPRFGVLDGVIILLIIVAVAGVYFRYSIIDFVSGARNLNDYTISYSIEDIRYSTPDFIDVGDEVYFANDGKKFGTLVAVSENSGALSITPASEYFTNSKGEIVEILYPDNQSRVDAKGKLSCTGRYSEDGRFLVDGSTHIASGQLVNVKTEYVTVTIRIDKIAPTEES